MVVMGVVMIYVEKRKLKNEDHCVNCGSKLKKLGPNKMAFMLQGK